MFRLAFTIAAALVVNGAHGDESVTLGTYERTASLFSYPNNSHVVEYIDQTIEETVEHYVNASLRRDGYSRARARLTNASGVYAIEFRENGDELSGFVKTYEEFLQLGDVAVSAARDFHRKGKWRYNWRFMLPLGLPMQNPRSLEVMDFPPETLLLKTQDYLESNTTNRWTELLTLNGVDEQDVDLYGAILDIVPVCAPASDGKRLEESGIYDGQFDDYARPMLSLWTRIPNSNASRPIMALGAPMRVWFRENFGVTLAVLDVSSITLPDGRRVPIMGSNHPSYFFYAANRYTTGPDRDERNLALGLAVMKQDIVAACWQAEMGKNPTADPATTKTACVSKWSGRDEELLELVKKQAYGRKGVVSLAEKKTTLAELKAFSPTDEELRQLEVQLPRELLRRE